MIKTIFFVFLGLTAFSQYQYSQEVPSYKLAMLPSKYVLNRNDTLVIRVYLSGYGQIKKSKLMLYSDLSVRIYSDLSIRMEQNAANFLYQTFESRNFTDYGPEKEKLLEYYRTNKTDSFGIYPINIEYNPMIIGIVTDKPGTHRLYAVLTYTLDEETFHSDRIEFEFYINSWLDRNQTWLIIVGTVIAFIGLLLTRFRKVKT